MLLREKVILLGEYTLLNCKTTVTVFNCYLPLTHLYVYTPRVFSNILSNF